MNMSELIGGEHPRPTMMMMNDDDDDDDDGDGDDGDGDDDDGGCQSCTNTCMAPVLLIKRLPS